MEKANGMLVFITRDWNTMRWELKCNDKVPWLDYICSTLLCKNGKNILALEGMPQKRTGIIVYAQRIKIQK